MSSPGSGLEDTRPLEYSVGDLVFAKVKGFQPWPARVRSREGDNMYKVQFYATYELGESVRTRDVWPASDHFCTKFGKFWKKNGTYEKALWEMINCPDIMEGISEKANQEFEVEEILSRKWRENDWRYEVLWVGGEVSWVSRKRLTNCDRLLNKFLDAEKNKPGGRQNKRQYKCNEVSGIKKIEVDEILSRKRRGRGWKYEVLLASGDVTWVTRDKISDFDGLLSNFLETEKGDRVVKNATKLSGEVEVQSILSRRKVDGSCKYEVMWSTGKVSWVPREKLTNCDRLLDKFLQIERKLACDTSSEDGRSELKLKLQKTSEGDWKKSPAGEADHGTVLEEASSVMAATTSQILLANTAVNEDFVDRDVSANMAGVPPVALPVSFDKDFKISPDPRDWTSEQVVGELLKLDKRLQISDLGPIIKENVAGDVLLNCSKFDLREDLGLDFNTAKRVGILIDKLAMVVTRLEEVVVVVKEEPSTRLERSNSVECQKKDKVIFKVRSLVGNQVRQSIRMKVTSKVQKVLDMFSEKMEVPMHKMKLRCNGKVLDVADNVRNLDGQVVWITVDTEVKSEKL